MKPFASRSLRDILEKTSLTMTQEIDRLGEDVLFGNDVKVLAHNYSEKYKIDPVVILDEDISNRKSSMTKVPYYDLFSRDNGNHYIMVDGMAITCAYPFAGDPMLFSCQASTFSLSPHPEIDIRNGYFTIIHSYSLNDTTQNDFKARVEREISHDIADIRRFIGCANDDVIVFNRALGESAVSRINGRKKKLEQFHNASIALNASTLTSNSVVVPVKRRIIPEVGSSCVEGSVKQQTFCISDSVYAEVLQAIKETCSSYERNPASVKGQREEYLRDHVLTILNVMFPGRVGGETFRRTGKTDINIELSNRAAFVAECKVWQGESAIAPAITQLDGYTTWRDCKTALIFFVRIQGFIKLLESMEEKLRAIPGIRRVNCVDKNEFDCQYESVSHPGQITKLRVFFFDYYLPDKG